MNAIGVDVGGTKIAAAVVSPEGEILNEVRYPTQAVPPNRLVATIAGAITEVKDGFEVGGVCLAVPGLIMASINTVIFAPNLHEIENIRLDEEIGGRTGMSGHGRERRQRGGLGRVPLRGRQGRGPPDLHNPWDRGRRRGHHPRGALEGRPGRRRRAGARDPRPNGPALRLRQPRLPGGARLRHRHRAAGRGRSPTKGQTRRWAGSPSERQVLGEDVTELAQDGDEASICGPGRDGPVARASAWRGSSTSSTPR